MVALIHKVEMPLDVSDGGRKADEMVGDFETKLLLKRLPPRQRKAMKLHIQGYKYTEIAGRMGISSKTVDRYLYLARKKLKEILK